MVNEEFLKKLVITPRATGYEFGAQQIIKEYLEKDVDEIYADRVGNLYAVINPESPFKVMLAGHIDQIGFQISYIDDNGFLWFKPLGGFDTSTLPGKRVKVIGKGGTFLGVIGKKAIHLMKPDERKKAPEMEKLFIDIGCKDKEEASTKVQVGDFAVFDYGYDRLGEHNYAVSAGFDDSIGSFIVAEIMKELAKDKNFYAGVYGVSTVQEEIGLRGAIVAAKKISPDVGIAFDVGFASDAPEIDKKDVGEVKLGEGPIISIGPNLNPVLVKRIIEIAEKNEIPIQPHAANRGTGTDANAIQLSGAATALVGIPNRYMHTASEVISLDDVKNIVKLVVEVIKSITEEDTFIPF
ncbi:MAG: M42 family metallopeptidase [Candidatus Heimdallarchaeum aukensis]|uniref:M42 family metallopeptidase n=1 Tax=Candidatus Heimdallarchaeum aukensis TaxID=2876573 RepID=A0A9Y1BKV2_9ARCH|nr:MAG: M42 family metallopeptidase [Candidatus Heimdallarchaeum aukensis]